MIQVTTKIMLIQIQGIRHFFKNWQNLTGSWQMFGHDFFMKI